MEINEKRQTKPVMISFAKGLTPTFEIPFPAVTICPERKASEHDLDFAKLRAKNLLNLTKDEIKNLKALYQVCDLHDLKEYAEEDGTTNDLISILEKLSSPIDELFSKCSYGSRKLSDCKKLFNVVITGEGICYTFNMLDESDLFNKDAVDESLRTPKHGLAAEWFLDKDYESMKLRTFPHRVVGSGLHSGLSIELKLNKSDLNPGCKRGLWGFRLALHTPAELPHMSNLFYSIPLNHQTTIAVKPHSIYSSKDVKGYDPESRKCYFNDEKFLKYFKVYSKSSCELECLSNYVLSTCGCVKFSMARDNTTQVCDHLQLECVHEAEITFATHDLERKLLSKKLKKDLKSGLISRNNEMFKMLKKMESCSCLPSCTSLRYDAEVSQTGFMIADDGE